MYLWSADAASANPAGQTDPIQHTMDEIKNPAEVEQAAAQPQAPLAQGGEATNSVAEQTNPTEDAPAEPVATAAEEAAPAPAEATTAAEVPAEDDAAPAAEPAEEAQPEPATKLEVIDRLKAIAQSGGDVDRTTLEHLKSLYYRLRNTEVTEAREAYIAAGGDAETYLPAPDADEESFKAEMQYIREQRTRLAQEAELEKKQNLERKQAIIERIKQLAASPDEADKGYDEVKRLQAEWKEIKSVPAENATELWKNYQLYTEQFYDQLRLGHEMRAYDFKKNLELKTHLCEAAEKLADVADPISAFHQLQKLHQEYRETGPVAKDLREQIWKRFKDASTLINKRHQDHFEQIKQTEEQNLQAKTALCEKVEALDFSAAHTFAEWDELAKTVMQWQAEWKQIGFTPRKVNSEIFERFRAACDKFFQAKSAHFKQTREQFSANLAAKRQLIAEAEALKESTDWAATTQRLVELQKQWKQTGSVARKLSDEVWKQFNDACNHFFDRKKAAGRDAAATEEANLTLKQQIIAELEQLAANTGADNALQAVRDLQARWNEAGHVPFRKKEKLFKRYRELCDAIYDALHQSAGRRRIDNFRRDMAEKGGTELTRERSRLQNAIEQKRQEITTYETNLTFFRTSSKKGNSLLADAEKRVAHLKEDLASLQEKLKLVVQQIKDEEQK